MIWPRPEMCPIAMLFFLTLLLGLLKYCTQSCSDNYFLLVNSTSCPAGYQRAQLDDQELWKRAMTFTTKCLGYNAAAKIESGLGWKGAGVEHWMLITPDHANGAERGSRSPDLPPFVRNKRGKLALNFDPTRQVPTLCAKNSTDQWWSFFYICQ